MLGPKTQNNKNGMFTANKGFVFNAPAPSGPSGFRIEHRIGIHAPAEFIWEVLYDLERWPEWNPLYTTAKGQIRIGSEVELTLNLEGEAPRVIKPRILEWVPNDQIHWRMAMLGGLVSNTRFLEIEILEEASCIFSNGELFGGLLGPRVAKRVGRKVYRGFQAMSEALKARAEAAWQAQGGDPTSVA